MAARGIAAEHFPHKPTLISRLQGNLLLDPDLRGDVDQVQEPDEERSGRQSTFKTSVSLFNTDVCI